MMHERMDQGRTDHGLGGPGRTNEHGYALLTVLLALVGLTALASAGYVLSDTDLRVSYNHRASTYAYQAADAGLSDFLGRGGLPERVDTFTYATGTAIVSSEPMLEDVATVAFPHDAQPLYRVTSVAMYATPRGDTATRTVSTLALFSIYGDVTATSAIASGGGFNKNGNSGLISGEDHSDPMECPGAGQPVAGLRVPQGGFHQTGGNGNGGGNNGNGNNGNGNNGNGNDGGLLDGVGDVVDGLLGGGNGDNGDGDNGQDDNCTMCEGDPPVEEGGTAEEVLAETEVDWEAILAGDLITPSYTNEMPSPFPSDDWPVVWYDGDASVAGSCGGCQGTLIVTGDLTMSGSFSWEGLILVGGNITSNGNQDVEGAIISGLNVLTGAHNVGQSDLGNGNKEFKFHHCNLLYAKQGAFGGFAEVPGGWTERM